MNITISQGVRKYVVDLGERVASTFGESVLAGMTTAALNTPSTVTGTPWDYILNTAGYAALYALIKGAIAGFTPSNLPGQPSAGFLPVIPKSLITKVSGADSGT